MLRSSSLKLCLLLAALAGIVFLAARCGTFISAIEDAPEHVRHRLLSAMRASALLVGLTLVTGALGVWWLINAVRRRDSEQHRVRRLAELGMMAGGLSHEIRNSLNALHTHIGLLRKQVAGQQDRDRAQHRIDLLEGVVEELEELVTQFLAFARPNTDQLEEVDISSLVRQVLDFVAIDLDRCRVKVRTELAVPPLTVYADATKLKRALLNLVINAWEAMPDGGTLTISLRPLRRAQVLLEVRDTGVGIRKEEQKHLFQTFYSTKPEGTGLGLAIVKRTIEDCGGTISFESEAGRGTSFRICLPAAEKRRAQLKKQQARQPLLELVSTSEP